MDTPYYLLPSEGLQKEFGTVDLFSSEPSGMNFVPQGSSIWQDLGESINKSGDYVWDSAKGIWVWVKDLGQDILDKAGEGYSWFKFELIMWLGVALLVVWYVAKSGILKQAAAFV